MLQKVQRSYGSTFYNYVTLGNTFRTDVAYPDTTASSTLTDAAGRVLEARDEGGKLLYTYHSHGGVKTISLSPNTAPVPAPFKQLAAMEYDGYGRQTQLTELNSGVTQYQYNAFGELIYQKDSKGNEYTDFMYDPLGRLTSKTGNEGVYTYAYETSGAGINQLKSFTGYNGTQQTFSYDNLGRMLTFSETIDNQVYEKNYTYDAFSRVASQTYKTPQVLP